MAQPNGYYTYKGKREDVLVCTANYTVEPHLYECGNFSNSGASGAVAITLPPALPGRTHTFHVETAQDLTPTPNGTDEIYDTATGYANAAVSCDDIGSSITYKCLDTGYWAIEKHIGAWT